MEHPNIQCSKVGSTFCSVVCTHTRPMYLVTIVTMVTIGPVCWMELTRRLDFFPQIISTSRSVDIIFDKNILGHTVYNLT